jgi:hypothetical protein
MSKQKEVLRALAVQALTLNQINKYLNGDYGLTVDQLIKAGKIEKAGCMSEFVDEGGKELVYIIKE